MSSLEVVDCVKLAYDGDHWWTGFSWHRAEVIGGVDCTGGGRRHVFVLNTIYLLSFHKMQRIYRSNESEGQHHGFNCEVSNRQRV